MPRNAKVLDTLKSVKDKIKRQGKPRLATAVDRVVKSALSAVRAASRTHWVRGPPTKYGGRGRLVRVSGRKFGAGGPQGEAPAAAGEAPVAAAAAAVMQAAENQLAPGTVSEADALLHASLVYKRVIAGTEANRITLEVRLSQIDEHGLGLYTMTGIRPQDVICTYGGLVTFEKLPPGASQIYLPFSGGDYYLDPTSVEDNVGRYAYPCEHLPAGVCNATLVIDEENLNGRVVATKRIFGGSEIFLQWPNTGAKKFSNDALKKVLELARIEDKYNQEVSKWRPSSRGFLSSDYVENLIQYIMQYSKTRPNPHMHMNHRVLALMREGGHYERELDEYEEIPAAKAQRRKKGQSVAAAAAEQRKRLAMQTPAEAAAEQRKRGYLPIYDNLAIPVDGEVQLPRRDGGTVMVVGVPGHFAVWKFIYRDNDTWDSYIFDSMADMTESTRKIAKGLYYFAKEASAHGMTIREPRIINLGWQGHTEWSSNGCGAFAALAAKKLMVQQPDFVELDADGQKPGRIVLEDLMDMASRIIAKHMVEGGFD